MREINSRILRAIEAYKDCPAELVSGMSAFARALSVSHTLTSRRFSVWSLLKRYVDEPFVAAQSYSGVWNSKLLYGFRPSVGSRQPGQQVLEQLALYPAVAHFSCPAVVSGDTAPADKTIRAMERWIQCLRLAIHSCDDARGVAPRSSAPFTQALDLMREVLRLLKRLRPRHQSHPELGRVPDNAAGGDTEQCCELCWRPSMRWAAVSKSPHLLSSTLKSARFCEIHDPGNPKSRYRTDLRYKAAFLQELDAVCNFSSSAYALELPGLPHPDEHMLRRLAYDRVHSGIRTLNARNKPSLKERVWVLYRGGCSQSDIARKLGISRQAVCSAVRELRSIWNDHQIRLGNYLLP